MDDIEIHPDFFLIKGNLRGLFENVFLKSLHVILEISKGYRGDLMIYRGDETSILDDG